MLSPRIDRKITFSVLIVLSVVLCFSGCSDRRQVVVLSYSDFGPQVVAVDLLGPEWNPWDAHGDQLDPDVPIVVVVFDGISLEEARRQYPTVEGQSDFRWIPKRQAVEWLHARLLELRDDPGCGMAEIAACLDRTWKKIQNGP